MPAGDRSAGERAQGAPIWAHAVERFPPADRVLSTILTRQAARYGDRTLFVCGETRWSYAETVSIAAASAARLLQAGLRPGDRVALMCSNRPEFLEVYLGCAWMGAVTVPLNTALRGIQLSHILRNSTPKLLVIEPALLPAIETLERDVALPDRIWTIGEGAAPAGAQATTSPLPALGQESPAAAVRPGDTVAILYTSGTTGPSKGVCCPQAQMFWWGVYSARALGIVEGDVLFTTLPLFHTNALNAFYQAILNGCTYVLDPKFSASGFWAAARRHQATVGYLLGAMAVMLLAQPQSADDTAHRMRVALGGGVPGQFHGPFLERFGVPLVDGYGSTETNFVFASTIPSDRPGTMGHLVEGAEARIVDPDDSVLPDGEAGELLLRSTEPFAFATGYFGMPDKTVEAWRNLWFHTGDRVVRDADGHYRFVDRMKDFDPPARRKRVVLGGGAGPAASIPPSLPVPCIRCRPNSAKTRLRRPSSSNLAIRSSRWRSSNIARGKSPISPFPASSGSSRKCRSPRMARSKRLRCARPERLLTRGIAMLRDTACAAKA